MGAYYFDYRQAREQIMPHGFYFHALIIAAFMQADSTNTARLKSAFPDVYEEVQQRYNAPGGLLEGETRHD